MKIKPIKSESDYQAALACIEELWHAEPSSDEAQALDVLSTLVAAYEDEHAEMPPPDPIEAILFRMEQEGLSRRDLEKVLGVGRGRVSEILGRKRSLSLRMIRKLAESLDIPAEILIQPTRRNV